MYSKHRKTSFKTLFLMSSVRRLAECLYYAICILLLQETPDGVWGLRHAHKGIVNDVSSFSLYVIICKAIHISCNTLVLPVMKACLIRNGGLLLTLKSWGSLEARLIVFYLKHFCEWRGSNSGLFFRKKTFCCKIVIFPCK